MSGNELLMPGPEVATEVPPSAQTPGIFGEVIDATVQAQRRRSVEESVAAKLGVNTDKLCDLLRNVWHTSKGQPELTKQEMFNGMSLIARFDLDPISREVYVTRDKTGRLLTIVGIDGWIKILNRTPHYDGFDVELGWNEDETKLLWAETRIYSKERSHPVVYRGFMQEYMKMAGNVAQKAPWHMLRIFSLRHAARLFTPLGGNVVLQEEAEWMMREQNEAPDPEGDALAAQLQAKAAKAAKTPKSPATEPPPTETPQQPTAEPEEPEAKTDLFDSQDEVVFRDTYREQIHEADTTTKVEGYRDRARKAHKDDEICEGTLVAVEGICAKRLDELKKPTK